MMALRANVSLRLTLAPLVALALATSLLAGCDGARPAASPAGMPAPAQVAAGPTPIPTSTSTPGHTPAPAPALPTTAIPFELPAAGTDPFSSQRLQAPARQSGPPLEAASVETMELVGSVFSDGQGAALLRLQGRLFTVRVGDRLGPDQSRISRITPTGMELQQRVRNKAGQVSERTLRWPLGKVPE